MIKVTLLGGFGDGQVMGVRDDDEKRVFVARPGDPFVRGEPDSQVASMSEYRVQRFASVVGQQAVVHYVGVEDASLDPVGHLLDAYVDTRLAMKRALTRGRIEGMKYARGMLQESYGGSAQASYDRLSRDIEELTKELK